MKQSSPAFRIHFVCRGNTYRSRLAAAYFAQKAGERFSVSSSGLEPERARVATSEAYTQAVAKRHGLTTGLRARKTATSQALLAAADVIIFMNGDVYDEAAQRFQFDARQATVWHIPDLSHEVQHRYDQTHDVRAVEVAAERTYAKIVAAGDELLAYLTKTSWVDVVDHDNQPLGFRLPINWATDRGLWHRGVHVVVKTADGKFVVGKRVPTIVFAPGMLEISLGGGIDAGETPLQAAVRESGEELGVSLPVSHFRPLFMYRSVSYHPHYKKHSRVHLYVYCATLPVHSSRLHAQPGEVAELRLLSKRQVKHLLRTHRMTNFGALKWSYKLYQKAVAYSSLPA